MYPKPVFVTLTGSLLYRPILRALLQVCPAFRYKNHTVLAMDSQFCSPGGRRPGHRMIVSEYLINESLNIVGLSPGRLLLE